MNNYIYNKKKNNDELRLIHGGIKNLHIGTEQVVINSPFFIYNNKNEKITTNLN